VAIEPGVGVKRQCALESAGFGVVMQVDLADTLRVLPSGGGKGNLIPASGTTFYNGREGAPRTVTFNLGPDGRAISMTLKAPGSERTLKKLP